MLDRTGLLMYSIFSDPASLHLLGVNDSVNDGGRKLTYLIVVQAGNTSISFQAQLPTKVMRTRTISPQTSPRHLLVWSLV